ncbi:Peroxisomal integral membrane peroxin [Komagataella phaffii GS115]|uniref:Peroxisomal integral membrane peroxin n=2 Tax=Komagataella phaffii TaxID=460519 RepID=C4R0X2_KOMPG|nr:Peroxisomal integral membrane peroxin [Komagataella phaffii GS115]AOA61917.1 GQ67_00563T0 [Komagataella phaffii]AOA68188.1 GQ68_00825T0 [Komagataella phaffii GS115]CAY69146.1 Peroxisomal integral membrane peroxin [Komagataella phaffii GS115]
MVNKSLISTTHPMKDSMNTSESIQDKKWTDYATMADSSTKTMFTELFGLTSDQPKDSSSSSITSNSALMDKFVERIISMALPTAYTDETYQEQLQERLQNQQSRPPLSVNIMTKNFIQLNSRLSIPFILIDEVVCIINWKRPYYTLSVLLIASLLILKPTLLTVFPMFYILSGIMVPAYLKRHPPEKNQLLESNPIPAYGEPVKDITLPKPVPDLSREFVVNLTDLQNRMLLYVITFDFINSINLEFFYFKDDAVSNFVFLALFALATIVFTSVNIIPLEILSFTAKFTLLVGIWGLMVLLHPENLDQFLALLYSEEYRLKLQTMSNKVETRLKNEFSNRVDSDQNEIREIEIFELQTLDEDTNEWKLLCYCNDPFAINSTRRDNEKSIKGCLSLQSIMPPIGWKFDLQDAPSSSVNPDSSTTSDETDVSRQTNIHGWTLDLSPTGWVHQNYLQGVLSIDDDGKWCYDKKDSLSTLKKLSNCYESTGKEYRRRRWIRTCKRDFVLDSTPST